MSLYDVVEMYFIGIVKGALTTRASGIAYSFFMAIFPFMLFVLTLIPYIPIEGFQESLMQLIAEILPPKTYDAVDSVLVDIIKNKQSGLLSFGFLVAIFLMTNGVNAIFGGFEYSYHVKEARNFFKALFSLDAYIVHHGAFFTGNGALSGFYQLMLNAMIKKQWIADGNTLVASRRGAIFVLMVFTVVSILYRYGTKSVKHVRFFSPGSIFTTVLSPYILPV